MLTMPVPRLMSAWQCGHMISFAISQYFMLSSRTARHIRSILFWSSGSELRNASLYDRELPYVVGRDSADVGRRPANFGRNRHMDTMDTHHRQPAPLGPLMAHRWLVFLMPATRPQRVHLADCYRAVVKDAFLGCCCAQIARVVQLALGGVQGGVDLHDVRCRRRALETCEVLCRSQGRGWRVNAQIGFSRRVDSAIYRVASGCRLVVLTFARLDLPVAGLGHGMLRIQRVYRAHSPLTVDPPCACGDAEAVHMERLEEWIRSAARHPHWRILRTGHVR